MQSDLPHSEPDQNGFISFSATDDEYRAMRFRCAQACEIFNNLPLTASIDEKARAWHAIVSDDPSPPSSPAPAAPTIKQPIIIHYGTNLHISPSATVGPNVLIGDTPLAPITIGARTIIAPYVRIHGVGFPLDWRARKGGDGVTLAGSVEIGRDCWVGDGVVILPGVKVGDGAVIGAGAVVTQDVPAYHLAEGNPAHVIRKVAADVRDAEGLVYDEGNGGVNVVETFSKKGEENATRILSNEPDTMGGALTKTPS